MMRLKYVAAASAIVLLGCLLIFASGPHHQLATTPTDAEFTSAMKTLGVNLSSVLAVRNEDGQTMVPTGSARAIVRLHQLLEENKFREALRHMETEMTLVASDAQPYDLEIDDESFTVYMPIEPVTPRRGICHDPDHDHDEPMTRACTTYLTNLGARKHVHDMLCEEATAWKEGWNLSDIPPDVAVDVEGWPEFNRCSETLGAPSCSKVAFQQSDCGP